MTNNDIIKLSCKALGLDPEALLEIFRQEDPEISMDDVADLLKEEKETGFVYCSDEGLLLFLDGLINSRRGKREGASRHAGEELKVSNNLVLKKLRIALELHDDTMREIFALGGKPFSRSELTPFFRKEGHRNYKKCSDKMLRVFLAGLAVWREK